MASCDNCNSVYSERDKLVSLVFKMAQEKGYACGLRRHDGEWGDEWRNVVFIDLPTGQVSWHIHDSELEYFIPFALTYNKEWDGHTTEEKYRRVLAYGR